MNSMVELGADEIDSVSGAYFVPGLGLTSATFLSYSYSGCVDGSAVLGGGLVTAVMLLNPYFWFSLPLTEGGGLLGALGGAAIGAWLCPRDQP